MSEVPNNDLPYEAIQISSSLSLRQLRPEEAEQVFTLIDANRDHLKEWLPWVNNTRSPEDSEQFIREMIKKREDGAEYGYAIALDDVPVGHMSLMHLNDGKEPEIGYWIASNASGRGITTEAAKALTAFGLETLNLSKIVIKADQRNIPSNKVAEKLGYTIERVEQDRYTNKPANVWSMAAPAAG